MDTRTQGIARQLAALGAATVYEAQGAFGALDAGIKPIDPGMRMAGPARTVDLRPGDNLMIHYALLQATAGDVLVLDAKGFLEADLWGDVLTAQALRIGLAGLLVHGAVRDATSIVEAVFPVFCRGLSIKGTAKHQPGRVDVPVVIGDVVIHPGDWIVGDRDGVAVVPAADIDTAIAKSLAREAKESAMREAIAGGATTADLLDLRGTLRRLGFE